jgi:V/A-type H+-transporting ATPase subunit A
VLLCADLINEAFLRQSAFSVTDRYCSTARQIAMMQTLSRFIDLAENAVQRQVSIEAISALPLMRRLRRMSEEIGNDHVGEFDDLRRRLEAEFNELVQRTEAHAS